MSQGEGRTADKSALLADLRARIRSLESGGGAEAGTLGLGFDAIDSHLPGGGLARACVHEVVEDGDGAATGFAAVLLARFAADGPVLWLTRRRDVYAPGLAHYGLPPERLLLLAGARDVELLWAMEEALRSRALGAVLGEVERMTPTEVRRLQLAAEAGRTTGLLLRTAKAAPATHAASRWRVRALPARPTEEPGLGDPRWRIELERYRGGRWGLWEAAWREGAWTAAPSRPDPAAAFGRRAG